MSQLPDFSSFDRAVDELFAQGYAQSVVETLNSYGDNALGFRLAGSPAEIEATDYLAQEFVSMGAYDVRKEPVPVDAWTLRGASVRVDERCLTASQFPGVPGTDGPLTAEIVYVGRGTVADYAGKDVVGKLVLLDSELDEFYYNLPGHEAQLHGAVGVVFTNGTNTAPYHANPNGLASSECRWNLDGVPAVFVSTVDGEWIKRTIEEAGSVSATVRSDVGIQMHDFDRPENGGMGYNVVAEIPGTDPGATAILVAAHYDAYFRSALDNTGAVAQMMTIAKAMTMSGTRLQRPIIFLASSGEEYGYADTQYCYLAGAWYAATVTHASSAPDPVHRWTGPRGRVGLFLNLEESPQIDAPLSCGATSDLIPWITSVGEAWKRDLLVNGFSVHQPYSVWHDGATFAFAGVPTIVTVAENPDYLGFNHTTADDVALIDYSYMSNLVKFYHRVLSAASTGIAPHDPDTQAAKLCTAASANRLLAAGAERQTVDDLAGALRQFRTATAAYTARKPSIPSERWSAVNQGLSALQRLWHQNLSGIDPRDAYVTFPFEQTVSDIEHILAAIAHLEAGPANADAAIGELQQVGLTAVGLEFSSEVYETVLRRYLPDYYMISWGGQVNQFWHVDITAEVRRVQAGDLKSAARSLKAVAADAVKGVNVPGAQSSSVHIDGLNERLAHVTASLKTMTPIVDELR
ncbi:MAG: M28 family peptidase [Streptosporangiaceae bacterium]